MMHYSEQAWADFVRGIASADSHGEITAHLESGCPDCLATFATWKRVHTAATNERLYTPPEELVRRLKLEFTASHENAESAAWAPAALVFDSLMKPLLAGVRAGAANARQLVYDAEGLTVDLRFDAQPRSQRVCAVGQVLHKHTPRLPQTSASVILWTAKGQPLLATEANEFGEFHLEFEAEPDLRLSIEVAGHSPVRIPLPNLS